MKDLTAANWERVKLGELCKIARGGSPRPIKKFITTDPDGVNWIKIGDAQVGGRFIESTKEKISRDGISRSRFVEPGAFLLSNSMSFGRPYILKTSGCIHDGWLVLEPDYKRVHQDFLYHILGAPETFQQFDSLAAGSTVRNLNIGLVESVSIPLPPLEEQQRIVAVLDEAFEGLARARAHAEANLQNARELFERQLGEYFSETPKHWVSRKLKQITSKIGSGATPKGGAGAYKTEGISLIRSLNVHDRWFKEEKLAFIDDEQADKLSNVVVEERDVLLNITGASIARCCVAPSEFLPARVNQHVSIIRPEHSVLSPEFLALMLTSQPYKDGLLKTGEDNGSTRQALTKALIENLEVAFPPDVTEQKSAVLALEAAELKSKDLTQAYQAKIQDLDDLRQSLLQRAFAGKLT